MFESVTFWMNVHRFAISHSKELSQDVSRFVSSLRSSEVILI
jgi:hypothetical protein